MQKPYLHSILGQNLWLTGERSIFWEEQKALIVGDLHFGKTGHFRKSGIAVPQSVYKEDLQRLVHQLQYFQPQQLIVVGDLFHSGQNKELELFKRWRNDFEAVNLHLVKGNHDVLSDRWYRNSGITVIDEVLSMENFHFTHDVSSLKIAKPDAYYFSGHIHPGIRIRGVGRQSLRFPCFYFSRGYCILPAFSRFTGLALIEPQNGESVFAIVNNRIVALQ